VDSIDCETICCAFKQFSMNIAIGIPVTKTAYLRQTLRSIAAQRLPVSEVVVVDNVADGDVAAIVASEYPAAKVYRNEIQLPPVENWNKVVGYLGSKWFILLSDDDYLDPEHTTRVEGVIQRYPDVGLVHTRVYIVDESNKVTGISPLAADWESCYDFLMHRQLGYRVQFLSDFVWNIKCFHSVGGFADMPSAWGTDDLTAFRVARIAGVAYSSEPTFYYRMHANNITRSDSIYKKLTAICALEDAFRRELSDVGSILDAPCVDFVRKQCLALMKSYRGRMQIYVMGNVGLTTLFKLLVRMVFSSSGYRVSLRVILVSIFRKVSSFFS
jgi:glycosyltransferase involved in cell wall biosynthesis